MFDALRIAPSKDLRVAIQASVLRFKNFGAAVAARIPNITMMITSSMSVKPLLLCCIFTP
jgi:hypothetical protein